MYLRSVDLGRSTNWSTSWLLIQALITVMPNSVGNMLIPSRLASNRPPCKNALDYLHGTQGHMRPSWAQTLASKLWNHGWLPMSWKVLPNLDPEGVAGKQIINAATSTTSRWTYCFPYNCCRLIPKHNAAWRILNHGSCTAHTATTKKEHRHLCRAVSISDGGVRQIPTEPRTLGPVSRRVHQVQTYTWRADWSHPTETSHANSQHKPKGFAKANLQNNVFRCAGIGCACANFDAIFVKTRSGAPEGNNKRAQWIQRHSTTQPHRGSLHEEFNREMQPQ